MIRDHLHAPKAPCTCGDDPSADARDLGEAIAAAVRATVERFRVVHVTVNLHLQPAAPTASETIKHSVEALDALPDHKQAIIQAAPSRSKTPITMTKLAALAGYGFYPRFRNAVDELVVDGWLVRSRKGICRSETAESACAKAGERSKQ